MFSDSSFLSDEEVQWVQDSVFSSKFPWTFSPRILSLNDEHHKQFKITNISESHGFQFVHAASGIEQPRSAYSETAFYVFDKFCEKNGIGAEAVIRVKFNLTTQSLTDDRMAPHIDHQFGHKTFLYYVNDSDGDTLIFNEQFGHRGEERELTEMHRSTPKAGKAILFNGSNYHTSLSPQKSRMRAVVNITFL